MRYLLVFFALLICNLSWAGGWTVQQAQIVSMHYETSFVRIKFSGGSFTLHDGCTEQNYVVLEDDTVRGDRQFSMLLAAYMSNKKVSVYTANCATKWNLDYPKVWAVEILD